jgi:hypothetical protein
METLSILQSLQFPVTQPFPAQEVLLFLLELLDSVEPALMALFVTTPHQRFLRVTQTMLGDRLPQAVELHL